MKRLDKQYLSLQFRIKIYSKNGTEFQSFFETIMGKAIPGFQKINPDGKMGDAGNDGYVDDLGIYYQVYAPKAPKVNKAQAAKKLQDDFYKLQKRWSRISEIKEYNFVFNDKYDGSIELLEAAKAELRRSNRKVKFKLFLAKDLEKVFLGLSEANILDLGFEIDLREAISNAYVYLDGIRTELDREDANSAQKNLDKIKDIISSLGDENLSLEYEILECRCLLRFEKVDDGRKKYQSISKRFPDDPRPLLYLAELYLLDGDLEKNLELLEKAKKIDSDYWLLRMQQLLRKLFLGEILGAEIIDENTFTEDPITRANFYRLNALFIERSGNQIIADSFIEKAIRLNPNRFSSYIDELSLLENRMISIQDASQRLRMSQELLDKAVSLENIFVPYEEIATRSRAALSVKKLNAFLIQEKESDAVKTAKQAFDLAITCYFDRQIEQILVGVMKLVPLQSSDWNKLLDHVKNSRKDISDELAQVIIVYFNLTGTLFTHGRVFFESIHNQKYLGFINDVENNNHTEVLFLLKNDLQFAIAFTNTLRSLPELRRQIIENLPDEKNIQKDKLLLLLNFDQKDFDEAFQILNKLDLSNLEYFECVPILQIAQHQKAWDLEVIILEKLLEKERNETTQFSLRLQLFSAYLNLKKFLEVMNLGEQLLQEDLTKNLLSMANKEAVLSNTIFACFERGKFDEDAFKKARKMLEIYQLENPSFEFKVGIETQVYINNNEVERALKSLVEGVKTRKTLSAREYARLYVLLPIEIANRINLTLDSLEMIQENTFVKIINKDEWYFFGDDNELDALPIAKTHPKYSSFIDKKVGNIVPLENKYSSVKHEEEIEIIFSIEQYILWQTIQNFQKLSSTHDLEWAQTIDIPQEGNETDFQNLLKFLEDTNSRTAPFFDLYCKNTYPLATLAVSEGGLVNAIGRLQNEARGFIHFSSGVRDEFEKQMEIAKKVVDKQLPFYIDGTSALVLSEIGLFPKIQSYLPNLKVPQSVINFLANITDKFKYKVGQTGYLGYARGNIKFSPVENDKREMIQNNFIASIKLFDSNKRNIGDNSSANKIDCFSEQKIPDELIDACILAQKENLPILTEDFLYLKLNELETKKKAPEYFSSLALLRTLYEEKKVGFSEWLEYFGYLSTYRFRFLSINSNDIEKAVFGDGHLVSVATKNIGRLNFPLVLSEEYGVLFPDAIRVVGNFLLKVIRDNSITIEIVEKIFVEIIETFPTKMSKKEVGLILLKVCVDIIEKNRSKVLYQPENQLLNQKIDKLFQLTKLYDWQSKLWTPN